MAENICENRKARFNYEILETFEVGVVLVGSEVKALREGKGNLSDAYAMLTNGELWLLSCHIGHFAPANQFNHEERRDRKLLMHRRELDKLAGRIHEKGLSLIPLTMYFKKGRVKVNLGLGKGKKHGDKRETTKRRESDREIQRVLKKHR